MSMIVAILIVIVCVGLSVTAMLIARRRAPDGSHFNDGDRASGVFGVLATGFALLLGLVIVLAFNSFDQSRTGAETEALLVAQQYETAQLLPPEVRSELSGDLVCYARSVINTEWPAMEDGTQGNNLNPWGAEMFRTIRTLDPQSPSEQAAYSKWLDQVSDREAARNDRIHGAVGVIPGPLWMVLLLSATVIFGYMLLFADSGEPAFVQATLMGSVVGVLVASLLLIGILDQPFRDGFGGLRSTAMQRTTEILEQEQSIAGEQGPLPCDEAGTAIP
jgi:hypothetical protein